MFVYEIYITTLYMMNRTHIYNSHRHLEELLLGELKPELDVHVPPLLSVESVEKSSSTLLFKLFKILFSFIIFASFALDTDSAHKEIARSGTWHSFTNNLLHCSLCLLLRWIFLNNFKALSYENCQEYQNSVSITLYSV